MWPLPKKGRERTHCQVSSLHAKTSHGKQLPGKPPPTYPDYIGRLINPEVPASVSEMTRQAKDRIAWEKIVVACKPCLHAAD